MIKIVFKSVMMIVILSGLINYAFYLRTGQMPLKRVVDNLPGATDFSFAMPNAKNIKLPDNLRNTFNFSVGNDLSVNETRVYKWTDVEGVVHYSQELPVNATAKEVMIDADVNVIKGLTPEEFALDEGLSGDDHAQWNNDAAQNDSAVNPRGLPLEQAQQSKKMLEERNAKQQKILDVL